MQKASHGDFWLTDVPGRGNRQWQATGSAKAPRQKHGCHVQTLPGDQTVWYRVSGGELGCKLRVEVRARPCSCLEALVRDSGFCFVQNGKSREETWSDLSYHFICCAVLGYRRADVKSGKPVKLRQQYRLEMMKAQTRVVSIEVVRSGHILVVFGS